MRIILGILLKLLLVIVAARLLMSLLRLGRAAPRQRPAPKRKRQVLADDIEDADFEELPQDTHDTKG